MKETWMVFALMFGNPVPLTDSPTFENETACLLYLATKHAESFPFKLFCSKP